MIEVMPNGDLKDKLSWTLKFEFDGSQFQPVESAIDYIEKFSDQPVQNRTDWLSMKQKMYFEVRGVFYKPVDEDFCPEVKFVVGSKEEALLFIPRNYLAEAEYTMNAQQAFRFEFVSGTPLKGDQIGLLGVLRTPLD